MSTRSSRIGHYIAAGFGIAMIAVGIAAFGLAAQTAPHEAHHGSPVDGLDAFATLAALVMAGVGLVLLIVGGLILRTGLRGPRPTPPRPPPPVVLPPARAVKVPPSQP